MKKRIWIPVVLALALAVMGFAGFAGIEALKTVQAKSVQATILPAPAFHGGMGADEQYLADALGITVDELNTAQSAAYNAAVDQALADGTITQAQADALKQRTTGGEGFGRGMGMFFDLGTVDFDSLLAKQLGISVDELNAARVKAHNAAIDAAVTAGNLTQEQADLMKGQLALSNDSGFATAMKSAFTAAVEQAQKAGIITQAQADALLNNLNSNGYNFLGRGGMGGMGSFHGGRGGHFGPMLDGGFSPRGGTAPSTGTSATPSTGL